MIDCQKRETKIEEQYDEDGNFIPKKKRALKLFICGLNQVTY
jgi:hypothetical protein